MPQSEAEAGREGETEAESNQDAQRRPELELWEVDTISDEDLLVCYLD